MAQIIPEVAVSNMDASLKFYNALGFVKEMDGVIDEKGSQWSSLDMDGASLWLIRQDIVDMMDPAEPRGNGVNIYISVDNVDAVHDKLGPEVNIVKEIETFWYGVRHFSISDPDGYILTFSMRVEVEGEKIPALTQS